MIRHQLRLSDCPPCQTFANRAAAHLENSLDKSLFRNTLPLTLFDGILYKGGPLVSILCAKRRGGRGIPWLSVAGGQLAVASGRMVSADDPDTSLIGRREQIPHRLRPVRDDKSKGLVTAQLKLRPFTACRIRLLPQAVKPPLDDKNRRLPSAQFKLHPSNLANSERRIAKSGHLRPGVSNHAG